MLLHKGVFSVRWYGGARACHNALLVFPGQAEPASAPVTQLLAALVLPLGLTLNLSAASETTHSLSTGMLTMLGF